jgi:hypothetical protein
MPTTQQTTATRRALRVARPQPRPPAALAALLPSQRRAAQHRAAAHHQDAVQRWLHDLTHR